MERPDFSIPSSSFWTVPQPTYLYQGTPPSSRMGQVNRDTDLSVPRRPTNYGRNQDTVYNQHSFSLFQAFGAWLQNQRREIANIPISIDYPLGNDSGPAQRSQQITECGPDNIAVPSKFYWKGSGYVSGSSSRTTYATPSTRAKELLPKEIEIMDVDGEISEVEVFTDASNRAWGIVVGSRSYSGLTIRSLTQGNSRPLGVGLLRQHNHASLCEKVWRHDVSQTTGIIGDNLETLFKNKHQTPGNIRAVNIEPCGRSKQTDCSNRMVFISGDVQEAESSTWPTRCRPVCFSSEQEGGSIFELVPRPQSRRTECVMGQPILLPTLEPNIASNPQSTQRENNHDPGYSNVEIGNMVSGSIDSVNFSTVIASSNNSCSRSQKRKVSAIQQQTLALDGMEDQRRFLQTQGLGTYAVDFILSNKRRVRRRSRYSSIQQRFLDWRILNKITTDISAPQIINYLSELFIREKLKVGTMKTYKSAILSLADNPTKLAEHPMFAEFTKTLDDSSIKSFIRPEIDILPILDLFRDWGPTPNLSVKQLTAKLCWLLSVTGFLRASDIHRIDDARSLINQGVLCLTIFAPKENEEAEKVAHNLCPTPHVNNSMWTVNRLIRFVNDREKPLSVDSITRYIKSISVLIQQDQDMPIPKGRAIGATLAANSGVSSDDIVAHAFWSNYSIFDSYYRLTRNSSNNLTESILNIKSHPPSHLPLLKDDKGITSHRLNKFKSQIPNTPVIHALALWEIHRAKTEYNPANINLSGQQMFSRWKMSLKNQIIMGWSTSKTSAEQWTKTKTKSPSQPDENNKNHIVFK
ncbi:hypothetical protein BB561_003065 [Smittium simulii]|uniref:Core-binding (CB) domain-containing protein n=1 Tax=Smittium simulii TaxID=133385 RepID=A0A2T9YN34_9FUNG|nr:hypothetical protein BB561_003065 [Smittium simulii]